LKGGRCEIAPYILNENIHETKNVAANLNRPYTPMGEDKA
jgi:hypothetical protein